MAALVAILLGTGGSSRAEEYPTPIPEEIRSDPGAADPDAVRRHWQRLLAQADSFATEEDGGGLPVQSVRSLAEIFHSPIAHAKASALDVGAVQLLLSLVAEAPYPLTAETLYPADDGSASFSDGSVDGEEGAAIAARNAHAEAYAKPDPAAYAFATAQEIHPGEQGGLGIDQATSRSDSIHDASSGDVVARTSVVASGVVIAGIVDIGSVHTWATATLASGSGKPELEGDVAVGKTTVGGVPARVTPEGIELLGENPVVEGAIQRQLEDALAEAGIVDVRTVPASHSSDDDGTQRLDTGGLLIVYQNAQGDPPRPTNVRVGGSRVRIGGNPRAAANEVPAEGNGGGDVDTGTEGGLASVSAPPSGSAAEREAVELAGPEPATSGAESSGEEAAPSADSGGRRSQGESLALATPLTGTLGEGLLFMWLILVTGLGVIVAGTWSFFADQQGAASSLFRRAGEIFAARLARRGTG